MGQSFNLSGYWTVELTSFNASKKRKLNLGLSDNSGEVMGTAVIHDSKCALGATLAGTFVGAAENSSGDNPLTGDQENSYLDTAKLTMTADTSSGVSSVTVDNGGSGYTSAPTVKFVRPDDPDGIRVTGVTVISGGEVIGVVVTRSGTGYTIAPGITFSGGAGSGATATVTLADADNTITLTLTGTATTLFSTYNGV